VTHFGVQKILTILCRANSTNIAKDLRKVLLGLEAQATATSIFAHQEHGNIAFSALNL